jgi:hypothetical protein
MPIRVWLPLRLHLVLLLQRGQGCSSTAIAEEPGCLQRSPSAYHCLELFTICPTFRSNLNRSDSWKLYNEGMLR